MATLTTIPTQAGTEHIRVLLTMGSGTPSGTNALSLRATESYVTQTGDAFFAANISLDGIAPHGRQLNGTGRPPSPKNQGRRILATGGTNSQRHRNCFMRRQPTAIPSERVLRAPLAAAIGIGT